MGGRENSLYQRKLILLVLIFILLFFIEELMCCYYTYKCFTAPVIQPKPHIGVKEYYIKTEDCKIGNASYYADMFEGRIAASGKIFNQNSNFVAHNELPFGTKLMIYNPSTRKIVTGVVEDRGGFNKYNRHLDLSKLLMEELGGIEAGVIRVIYWEVDD